MYAIVMNGGKQYKVALGNKLKLELMDTPVGESFDLRTVLVLSDGDNVVIGKPYVSGAKVSATVVGHGRYPKIKIIKHKRRKHSDKQMGHRQYFTEVRIDSISQL